VIAEFNATHPKEASSPPREFPRATRAARHQPV
jgi:hypothetical protein